MSKIILKNVGRGKVSKTMEVKAKTLDDLAQLAYQEVNKHLLSSEVELVENDKQSADVNVLEMTVFVGGFRPVGEVTLQLSNE